VFSVKRFLCIEVELLDDFVLLTGDAFSDHGIDQGQQLAHAGGNHHFAAASISHKS
tara:strand:+ start:1087 stop:1254 length:168 start_codon:yes stop_codon:yes gene_type:complete